MVSNNIRFQPLCTALLLAACLCQWQAAAQATRASGIMLDRIVAVVNDGVVLQSELDRQVASITARLNAENVQLPPRELLVSQILERLILEEIQMQRAARLGLQISDDMLNAAMSRIAQRNNISLSQLPAILAQQGLDYTSYRDDVRREMTLEQLRSRDLLSRVDVTREEAEQYLATQDALDNSQYEIAQILIAVSSDATPEDVAAAEQRANEVYEKLENGEDFGRMAVSYSRGQQALQGGLIGWRRRQELPTIFADIVADLDEGGFSAPIRSNSGFHIVKLNQKRGQQIKTVIVTERNVRHILVEVNELRTEAAAEAKAQTLHSRLVDGEDFAELARNESDDLGSATSGGDLDWTGPGTFVPPFEARLAEMQPGELSEPVKTQFGWHIIELLDTRQQDKTEEARINEAAGQIRVRKAQEESESWLLRMRDEAFVDIRL